MSLDLLAAARAAYRIDGADEVWLAGILAPLERALGHAAGGWIATYDATHPGLRLGSMAGIGMFTGWRQAMRLGVRLVPAGATRRALDGQVCATLSGLFGSDFVAAQPAAAVLLSRGVRDALGLNARDAGGTGVVAALHLRAPAPGGPGDRPLWEQVAAHIAAGARLRAALRTTMPSERGLDSGAEAIVERDGRVVHAEPPAQSEAARDVLRRAATALAAVGAVASRAEARAAMNVWEGLVAGRWTLLDHFDRDGRRYFVVRKNVSAAPTILSLTGRQRQVVALAALGHTNRLIAYELGITESTVSQHLRQAAERLGATSFSDLMRRFARHAGPVRPVSAEEPSPADAGVGSGRSGRSGSGNSGRSPAA